MSKTVEERIYYKVIVPLKQFFLIDYAVNYLIDLEEAERMINEPYFQAILEDLYYLYEDTEATVTRMLSPYIQELADKIEYAEDDMRITTDDYDYLLYTHQLLRQNDLKFATFLAQNQLTYAQCEAIKHRHNRFQDDEYIQGE